jgi:hypothetical protein
LATQHNEGGVGEGGVRVGHLLSLHAMGNNVLVAAVSIFVIELALLPLVVNVVEQQNTPLFDHGADLHDMSV